MNPTCAYCGIEFLVNRLGRKQIFCSKHCWDNYEYHRKWGKQKNEKKVCEICCKQFTPTVISQKHCSDKCRNRKSHLKRRQLPDERIITCKICGKEFTAGPIQHNVMFCSRKCKATDKSKKESINLPDQYIRRRILYASNIIVPVEPTQEMIQLKRLQLILHRKRMEMIKEARELRLHHE